MNINIPRIQNTDSGNFFLIAGPCAIEGEQMAFDIAGQVNDICRRLGIPYIFKGSYRKANRSKRDSFTGIGDEKALGILRAVGDQFGIPVTTDIHTDPEAAMAAEYVDVLQIPAFLCRQTDLLIAAAESGRIVNVKKGQFLAPWEMRNVVNKIEAAGGQELMLTERGSSFGYNNLVVDMRSLPIMRGFGYPVVYDATHSLQLPGGLGEATAGMAEYIPNLARAAVACGIDGLFMEVHDHPAQALSDATTQFPLEKLEGLLLKLVTIHRIPRE